MNLSIVFIPALSFADLLLQFQGIPIECTALAGHKVRLTS